MVVLRLSLAADAVKQELMTGFYRRLLAGGTVLKALREAQMEVRARHPEPRPWGGWNCHGNPDAVLPG